MQTLSTHLSHGGTQGVFSHVSTSTETEMAFSVFTPPGEGPFPVVWYLSGLTCTHANVTEKGEFRAACAELGLMFVAPDTSPRGEGVADDEGYDFGKGAGFYVDATQAPWAEHYKMRSYIEDELPELIGSEFPADMTRQAITGHSMGGHGALTIALRNPERFKSVSAFSPICNPSAVPWGMKALSGYLGADEAAWADYDAVRLIEGGARVTALRVEQGTEDQFLDEQLSTDTLARVCEATGQPLELNMRGGYDHSYYFISSFMADHLRWHAGHLGGTAARAGD